MYFSIYLFIYLGLEVDINICLMLFPSLAVQPALLLFFFFFCGLTLFSICAPLLPSLQLSKLKRLLALQRESCRPSCPLIKQIVSTHTRTHTSIHRDAHTDVSLCLSLYLAPVIWEGQVCVAAASHMPRDPWITAVQEGAEPPNQTINSALQRPAQFHLAHSFTQTPTHTPTLVARCLKGPRID